jgi:RecA/RadA recombinase
MKTKERFKAVQAAIAAIEKQFGKGAIMPLDGAKTQDVDVIPTGSLSLDLALGVGGLPRGRVIEIFGPESSGKTTLTLHVIAEAQKLGGTCAFIDAEHALDPQYARRLGVRLEELFVSQPDNGEQALEIADQLTRSGGIDLIVVDSVAALTPKAEIEGDMGDAHMGLQARLMSQALRKLTAVTYKQNTTIIFINQLAGDVRSRESVPTRQQPAAQSPRVRLRSRQPGRGQVLASARPWHLRLVDEVHGAAQAVPLTSLVRPPLPRTVAWLFPPDGIAERALLPWLLAWNQMLAG